jgi:hypothetical protein
MNKELWADRSFHFESLNAVRGSEFFSFGMRMPTMTGTSASIYFSFGQSVRLFVRGNGTHVDLRSDGNGRTIYSLPEQMSFPPLLPTSNPYTAFPCPLENNSLSEKPKLLTIVRQTFVFAQKRELFSALPGKEGFTL